MADELRGAINSHSTATSTGAWNGPKAKYNLPSTKAACRAAFAWVDPKGDENAKASYRYIHHEVSTLGKVGAANMTACSSGIAVLNGARKGTTIPDADRSGVHAHLAKHLTDGGKEPPELNALEPGGEARSPFGEVEERSSPGLEIRQVGGKPLISGYAARFGDLSDPIMFFRESVAKGAFSKTLTEYDQAALWNHNPDLIIGRRSAGTLSLQEDDIGLAYQISPPDTEAGRGYVESVRRGDVKGTSFKFQAVRDEWDYEDDTDGYCRRSLHEVKLFEISPTPFPAYPTTTAAIRAMFPTLDFDAELLTGLIMRSRRGMKLSDKDEAMLRSSIEHLQACLPAAPQPISAPVEDHPESAPALSHSPSMGRSLSYISKRLRSLEL